ncbi:MAG: hypothetical protein FWH48_00950 [Oscillospiraceae bacterium]|nr:hypothetical protein [Oscillospiraceae bacterium]
MLVSIESLKRLAKEKTTLELKEIQDNPEDYTPEALAVFMEELSQRIDLQENGEAEVAPQEKDPLVTAKFNIKAAAIVGFIFAVLTAVLSTVSYFEDRNAIAALVNCFTVFIVVGLSIEVYKKSRVCATILFATCCIDTMLYCVGIILYFTLSLPDKYKYNIMGNYTGDDLLEYFSGRILFFVAFFAGIKGTIDYHKITKGESPAKDKNE